MRVWFFRKHRCRHCGQWPRDGINRWHGLTLDGYCSRCMNTVPGLADRALEQAWESMLATREKNPALWDHLMGDD